MYYKVNNHLDKMGLGSWLKNKMILLAIATSNVEKSTLTQDGVSTDVGIGQEQRLNQGRLSDSLQRGEITQEVKELRWRMYKIIKATDGVTAVITGYDEDGMPIVETKSKPKKRYLKNVKTDNEDSYKPIMVVDNSELMLAPANTMTLPRFANVSALKLLPSQRIPNSDRRAAPVPPHSNAMP